MNTKKTYIYIALIFLLIVLWWLLGSRNEANNIPEEIKIALRDVGHNILLANNDSSSLVLPVKQFEDTKYRLTFEKEFSILPDSLVTIIKESFNRSNLPKQYIIEVVKCVENEIAYSYKMRNETEESIIPCGSRTLTRGCYAIETHFLNTNGGLLNRNILLFVAGFLTLLVLWNSLKKNNHTAEHHKQNIILGNYTFYPNQNKLALKRKEIQLSKKEGELLSILASHLNQVVKREDLSKQVWEDNGVVVGRSLDTYISKLRKKLKDDSTIKLSNIHGVGYKLECLSR